MTTRSSQLRLRVCPGSLFFLAVGLLLQPATYGQGHTDVQFAYVDSKIEIQPPEGSDALVFESVFATSGIDQQIASLPGFASERDVGLGIGSGDEIVYNVLENLLFSEGNSFNSPTSETRIRIENTGSGVNDTEVSAASGPQDGSFSPGAVNRVGAAGGLGDFHVDLRWNLEPNNFPVAPPPSEFGAYGVKLNLSTNAVGIDDSDPLFFVFNFGLPSEAFDTALAAFAALLGPDLAGDYNDNGTIDAADYTVWRDRLGSAAPLPNDPIGGVVGEAQYDQWKTSFASAASALSARAVPEPPADFLVLMVAWLVASLLRQTTRPRPDVADHPPFTRGVRP